MKSAAIVLGVLAMIATAATAAEQGPLSLSVTGGTYNMFTHDVDKPVLIVKGPEGANVKLVVTDAFGQPTAWNTQVTLPNGQARVAIPDEPGYFRVDATAEIDGEEVTAATDLGIIPQQAPGCRPDSFFASNTSSVRTGEQLKLLNKIGMRVQRSHFAGNARCTEPADGSAVPMNFDHLDHVWREAKESGSWVLPIVGYALPNGKSELANQTGMHGPPRDFREFVATYENVVKHYPEITTWEFWNEPWIFGWTWAATPQEYRELQTMFCKMALKVNPDLRILAGNSSMFVEDHIEPYGECWKGLIEGTTHHPYMGVDRTSLRASGQARSTDHGMQVTRRMGLPYYYLTEGGTRYGDSKSLNTQFNNAVNAKKIVQYHVYTALCGAFQANAQWDIGYGPGWTLPNTAYAVMTSFLEDRPCVAEIWPHNELIWGAIFSNPANIDGAVRKLPRADELKARWDVAIPPERKNDQTKVAVIYSLTGPSNDKLDTGATITVSPAADLQAFDLTGRELAATENKLVLPFSDSAVYLTTDKLSIIELRDRIAGAKIEKVTPVNIYACSLEQPADQPQKLIVRVENQLNRELSGTVSVTPFNGQKTQATFTAPSGELIDVAVPWAGIKPNAENQYGVTVAATTDAGSISRKQVIAAARFVKKTVKIDGTLNDWNGVTPVLLDSDRLKGGVDLTQYLLNPNMERPTGSEDAERVVARLYTAYDDENVYIAMAVNEKRLYNASGEPVVKGKAKLPYNTGTPNGLNHVRYTGDSLMFGFGFRDRVPGWGRQSDDPWKWKGFFCDTDYLYVAHVSTTGPKLTRLWDENSPRRTAYQIDRYPFVGPIKGARIEITRDEVKQLSVYEMAIPRNELKLFDPAAKRLRFAFQLITDKPVNGSSVLRWAEAAGVFDYWWNSGSFNPSWEENLPCQTFFGIE